LFNLLLLAGSEVRETSYAIHLKMYGKHTFLKVYGQALFRTRTNLLKEICILKIHAETMLIGL